MPSISTEETTCAPQSGLTISLLKLRIGVAIAASALAGIAVASGPGLAWWQIVGLALAILGASGAAGAFNHYYERDVDRLMRRTRTRPFASGTFKPSPWWLVGFLGLLAASLGLASVTAGNVAAAYVFLGAFTYGIVYTVWLKRRSTWNIVVGGLAGSFAVLAGAAAVDPSPQVIPTVLAVALFLWTPPHFWSLAAAKGQDYAKAGIPMLPVVVPAYAWTLAILVHSVALAVVSLVPLWFGEGLLYGLGAGIGGGYFVWKSVKLYRDPSKENAMANFFASLVQLGAADRRRTARQRRPALVMTRCRVSACGAIALACLFVAPGYAAPASLAARSRCSARQGKAGDGSSDRQLYAGRHERSVIGAARLPRQAAGDQPGLHRLQFGLPADHPACHRRRERGGTDDSDWIASTCSRLASTRATIRRRG